jgi:hypothetical protein
MVDRYIRPVPSAVGLLGVVAAFTGNGTAAADDKMEIESTLAAYSKALNGGQTSAVLPLYTEDGIFMPPYSQSAIGRDAVRKAYDNVFKELKFNVKFNIAEVVQMLRPGRMCEQTLLGLRSILRSARPRQRIIRNCSSSRRTTTAGGESLATASHPPICQRSSCNRSRHNSKCPRSQRMHTEGMRLKAAAA